MLTISLKNIVKPADPKFLEPARIIPQVSLFLSVVKVPTQQEDAV